MNYKFFSISIDKIIYIVYNTVMTLSRVAEKTGSMMPGNLIVYLL